jgi:diguanylate cyclase (GGDEF)-like protein
MRYDFIIAISLFIISAFMFVGAWFLFSRKEQLTGLKLTGIFVLANAVYATFYAGFILNDYENIKLLFNNIQYFAIPFLAPLWFLISLKLKNRNKKFKWYLYFVLFIIPILTLIANFIYQKNGNWYQLLYFTNHRIFSFNQTGWEGFTAIIFTKGPLYYTQNLLNLLLLSAATVNFFKSFKKNVFLAKTRSLILFLISLVGFILITLALLNNETSIIDFTPFFTSLFAFVLFFALFHYELFDLVPKAYQLIFQESLSPTIILDSNFNVVNMNRVAIDFFETKTEGLHHVNLAELCHTQEDIYQLLINGSKVELEYEYKDSKKYFLLELLTLTNQYFSHFSNGFCAVFYDITSQKEELKKMEHMASYDELTGIFNRRFFYRLATDEFDKAKIENNNLIIIMFDLDDFKVINDIYGHLVGDYVLAEMAKRIKDHTGDNAIFARYGGEEFIIMQTDILIEKVKENVNFLCTLLGIHTFIYDGRKIHLTASFGVSGAKKRIDKSLETYIKEADDMLYCAKGNGKNQVFYTNDLS